jgi:hypothetical protein
MWMNAIKAECLSRGGWRRVLTATVTLMGALMVGLCGCEDEETDSDVTTTRFFVDRELTSYSSVDNYTWDTTLNRAVATIRVKDFTHGDTTFRVFDALGNIILAKAVFTPNNTIYTGGNDFVTSEVTALGVPGMWRVELAYDNFTGDISITME